MKYLPVEYFCISTSLTPIEVIERLQKEIESPKAFSFKNLFARSSKYYFTGHTWRNRFELLPIIEGRNSFIPQITGSVEAWLNGSRLKVKMRLQPVVLIFMCIWLGGALFGATAMLISSIVKGQLSVTDIFPFCLFLFGYLLAMWGFKPEARDAKARLLKVLDGKIEP